MDQPRDLFEPMTRIAWGRIVQIQDGIARVALGAFNPNQPHEGILLCELPPELGQIEVDRFVEVLLDAPTPSGQWTRGDIDAPQAFGIVRQALAFGEAYKFDGTFVAENRAGVFFDAQGQACRAPPTEGHESFSPDSHPQKLRATGVNRSRSHVLVRIELNAAQSVAAADQRRQRTEIFSVNERVSGRLKSVSRIGAFVELMTPFGPIDGLVRRVEASWDPIANIEECVDASRPVQAVVIAIPDRGAIELSIRALAPSPWETFGAGIHLGDQLEGVIKNIVDYGAFIRIFPGLDALAHISSFAPPIPSGEIDRHFSVGQTVRVEVVAVDADKRRINVAVKNMPETDDEAPVDEGVE